MRKKFVQFAAMVLALGCLLPIGAVFSGGSAAAAAPVPVNTEMANTVVRVGIYYGSSALDGANLANSVGSGFRFGRYDGDGQLMELASTDKTSISVVKTANVYYGTYGGYTSYHDVLTGSGVAVGCYHLQLEGSYTTFEAAKQVADQYSGGFVAYIGGSYYARVGNYTSRSAAQAALDSMDVSATIKGTSAYGISVVATGTNTILFQYDDNGSGTGLGVEPIPAGDAKSTTWFKNYEWYGGFRYERVGGGDLTVVNMVGLDDYVKGVIPREMSSSWPMEALKAQTVCARNYALHNRNRHSNAHFDICNTIHCQVYMGRDRATDYTDSLVDSTAGVLAYYNGKPINCVYYSSNGGASEDSSVVWGSNQSAYPYMMGVTDPYEATVADRISGYYWTRLITPSQLTAKVKAEGYNNCSTIVSAKVSAYTDTGNPKTVVLTDSNGRNYTFNSRTMVSMLGLRSYRYTFGTGTLGGSIGQIYINGTAVDGNTAGLTAIDGNGNLITLPGGAYVITGSGISQVTPSGTSGGTTSSGNGTDSNGNFVISGAGSGHNVGMSQWGAYAMAKQGFTYDEILKFYYTGITVG